MLKSVFFFVILSLSLFFLFPDIDAAPSGGRLSDNLLNQLVPYFTLIGFEQKGHDKDDFFQKNIGQNYPTQIENALQKDLSRFLSEPHFYCKRPATYTIFSQVFGVSPIEKDCELRAEIPITSYTQLIEQDPFAVYDFKPDEVLGVDYVLIDSGSKISQRFGHAMLRFTMCAKEEKEADCLDQLDHQFVISYRGGVMPGEEKNVKKPIIVSFTPYSEILLEYSSKDERPIALYPLLLNREQINLLSLAFIEKTAIDRRNYSALKNNCATEILSLLSIVIPKKLTFPFAVVTPKNLRNKLIENKLIDRMPVEKVLEQRKEILIMAKNFKVKDAASLLKKSARERLFYWQAYSKFANNFSELGATMPSPPRPSLPQYEFISLTENHLKRMQRVEMARYVKKIIKNFLRNKKQTDEEAGFAKLLISVYKDIEEATENLINERDPMTGIPSVEERASLVQKVEKITPRFLELKTKLKNLLTPWQEEILITEQILNKINSYLIEQNF